MVHPKNAWLLEVKSYFHRDDVIVNVLCNTLCNPTSRIQLHFHFLDENRSQGLRAHLRHASNKPTY